MHESLGRIAKPALALSLIIGCLLALPEEVKAEAITGCPLGLHQGELWIRTGVMYVDANEAYMAEDTTSDPAMTPLNDSTHLQMWVVKFRIGYGVTDWFDVGLATDYKDKNMEFHGYKRCAVVDAVVWKDKVVNDHGLGDIWVSAKCKFLGEHSLLNFGSPLVEAVAFGIGYKFASAGDDQVTRGFGSGTNDLKVALLLHHPLPLGFDVCSHLTYQYVGKIRDVYMRNHVTGGHLVIPGADPDLWDKSGWDLGDKVTYKFNLEYELGERFEVAVSAMGWMQTEHADSLGTIRKDTDRFQHFIRPMVAFRPYGLHHHRKFALAVKIPYSYKTNFHAAITPMIIAMWTF